MESPLSFDSTENFRKKLLVRNLKPYNVPGGFSSNEIGSIREFNIVDYSVIDSESIEDIGDKQEKILYTNNKYGPTDTNQTYGEIVNINLNFNNQSNLGVYGYPKTINSSLDLIGNQREIFSKIKNIYKPTGDDFGQPVYFINNDQIVLTVGNGLYGITDTFGGFLEQVGNQQEIYLRVKNKYTPDNGTNFGDTKYSINNDLILGSNQGSYDFSDTIGNQLETIGNQQEVVLRIKNKYTPNTGNDYGDSRIDINDINPIGSNEGEYTYGDTIGNKLELESNSFRNLLFPISQYGPEGEQSQITVNPNINQQTFSNEGNYDYNDTLGSPLEEFAENNLNSQINQYGPQGQPGNASDENIILQTKPFEGEYDFSDTIGNELEIIGKIESNDAYVINKYVTGEGDYDTVTIDDIETQTTGQKYYNSAQSFVFLPSEYLPINLLLNPNPKGSNGSLSQDSDLAKIGAKQLQKEFKFRIATELLSETLGRINVLNSSIDPDSGEISVKPRLDPFNGLGILTGNVPILQRNYKITAPDLITGKIIGFVGKLTGLYSPYSIIPDEYFDYPEKRLLNQLIENPIGVLTNTVMGAIRSVTSPNIRSGSELFLAYTSQATKDLLWGQLFYNEFRPDYRGNSIRNPNLLSPKPNFYIGTRKNTITEIVSPLDALPEYKNGKKMDIAVYNYGEIGKEYEGKKITNYFFGLNSRSFYDGNSPITSSFSWYTKKSFFEPGNFYGPLGLKMDSQSEVFDVNVERTFNSSKSSENKFVEGSILDITQKIIDAGSRDGKKPLEHVGNAINQVSKVFNDGYIEITKGSRVIKYKTKNSVEKTNKEFEGLEYCRLFTKDNPYYVFSQLQKVDGNIRKSTYSIFDQTYNLNIAPMNDKNGQSTNIVNGKVKKYMFSLENLAWRTSNKKGFTVDDLPACEKGPNGGRIMWFPPYDITFSETIKPDFDTVNFLGRPEPIYTYKNTSRSGSISWSIIVDHASITNLIIDKELKNVTPESEITKIMDSFFAGCLKYDLYELSKKFVQFSVNDINEAVNLVNSKEDAEKVAKEIPSSETNAADESQNNLVDDLNKNVKEIFMFFDNDLPNDSSSNVTDKDYKFWYDKYVGNQALYTGNNSKIKNKIFAYPEKNVTPTELDINTTVDFSLKDYIDTRSTSISTFFNNRVNTSISNLDDFLDKISKVLDSGGEVKFSLFGTASSVGNSSSNKSLSNRRINSILKYILNKEYNGKKLETYHKKTLIIKEDAKGDTAKDIKDADLKEVNCSEKFTEKDKEGVFSVQAIACRRTKITNLQVKPAAKTTNDEKNENENKESLTNTTESDINQTNTPQNVNGGSTDIKDTPLYQGLVKKLIRNLLSECDYFEMINKTAPMVYEGIKSKFKNFHPIFHSITPEGLNSRLTFLQQCMRPGDTIPTVTETGAGTIDYTYQDAFNSAFGSPPILVLRFGDFWHTKIVPTNLSLKFEKGPNYDINPEGIGIQPMGVGIDLTFNFIGGHGIASPVSRLQNALSFNYYANTELYDERAEVTEKDLTKKYDLEFNELRNLNPQVKPQNNIPSNLPPIGDIKTSTVDSNGNLSGTISYEKIMDELITKSETYVKQTRNSLNLISETLGLGSLYIINTDRQFTDGEFDVNPINIYGKSSKFQNKIDLLFNKTKDDIENETTPLLASLNLKNFNNSEKRKIKRQLKKMVDKRKSTYISLIDENNNKISLEEKNLISVKNGVSVDKLNFLGSARDGFINERGKVTIYTLTGTTDVDPGETSPNTLLELKNDYFSVANDMKTFIENLEKYEIIDSENAWKDNFDFDLFIGISNVTNADKRTNMVFGADIIKEISEFIDEMVEPINQNEKEKWKTYFGVNLGYENNVIIEGKIYQKYIQQNDILKDRFKKFDDEYFTQKFNIYNPYNKSKKRIVDFSTQIPTNQNDAQVLEKIKSDDNTPGNTYNFKNKGFK